MESCVLLPYVYHDGALLFRFHSLLYTPQILCPIHRRLWKPHIVCDAGNVRMHKVHL